MPRRKTLNVIGTGQRSGLFRFLHVEIDGGQVTRWHSVIDGTCSGCGCRCTVNGQPLGEPHPVHSCCLIGARAPAG